MKIALSTLFMLVLVGFFIWWLGPRLVNDFSARADHFAPITDMRIAEAKCRSKLFVISFCDIKTEGPAQGEKHQLSYLILGSLGGERVSLLRSQEHPQLLTSNIGVDYFWNRVLSFAVFVGLLGALVVGGIVSMIGGVGKSQT